MKRSTRLGLFAILALLSLFFGQRFYAHYTRLMQDTGERATIESAGTPTDRRIDTGTTPISQLVVFGGGFFFSVLGLGLMGAHDLSHFVAARAMKVIYDEDLQIQSDPEYEQAEQEWANGNHLDAIRLLREYLLSKPREIHVLIRIAEIYEKDLQNPLAAALEYEEVLKHKLRPERWGWAAIHLCNIYTSKLHMRDKAVALLRRIEAECGDSLPGEKARKRLAMLDADEDAPFQQTETDNEPPPAGKG